MAHLDLKNRVVQAKLVYYGPGLCGKTTNLEYINRHMAKDQELMSLATEGDRTIFFDFMPIELGKLRGMDVRFKLYTVPGQVRYNQTRKMVLKNVDGVVFVADSQEAMMDANLESFDNLFSNLAELNVQPEDVAVILQYNKRDLPGVLPPEALDQALNPRGHTRFLASAMTGEGVVDTLRESCRQVLKKLMSNLPSREDPVVSDTRDSAALNVNANAAGSSQSASGESAAQTRQVRSKRRASGERPAADPSPSPAPPPAATTVADDGQTVRLIRELGERLAGKDDLAEIRQALAELATRTVAAHAERASETNGGQAIEARLASLPTKADHEALQARLGDLPTRADHQALQARLEQAPAKAEYQGLSAGLGQLPTKAEYQGLTARLGQLPDRAAFETFEQRLADLLRDTQQHVDALGPELARLASAGAGSSGAAAPSVALDGQLLERLESRLPSPEGLEAIRQQLAALPSKADLEALGERLSQLPTRRDLATLAQRLTELPNRGELESLRDQLTALATKTDLEALRAGLASPTGRATPRPQTEEAPASSAGSAADRTDAVAPPADAPDPSTRPDHPDETASAVAGQEETEDAEAASPEPPPDDDQAPPEEPVESVPAAAKEREDEDVAGAEPPTDDDQTPPDEAAEDAPSAPEDEDGPTGEAPAPSAPAAPEDEDGPTGEAPAPSAPAAPEDEDGPTGEAPAPSAPATPENAPPDADEDPFAKDPAHQNAARVARVMVADLWLYHKSEVEQGIVNDDFAERNQEALRDMRSTYESRIPQDIRDQRDYLALAIEQFLERKRKQLRL